MKLADYMKKNGISCKNMAAKIEITEYSLRRYLRGKRNPTREILQKIHEITNGEVTPNDFLLEANDNELPDITA